MTSSEPFYFAGGPTAVMLIHGYTGTPAELRPMGEYLHAAGYSVSGVLLAHHGGNPSELFGVGWQAWVASAERDLLELRRHHRRVVLAGFSLGALVALYLAARYPPDGLIVLAPALRWRNEWQLALSGVARYALPWFYPLQRADFGDPRVRASVREFLPAANLDDPALQARLRTEVRLPTGSIYEMVKLKRIVARNLWRIQAPLLALQGRHDQTVDPTSAALAIASVRSADKRLRYFEQSGHMLPLDAEREQVWQAAAEWLGERIGQRIEGAD